MKIVCDCGEESIFEIEPLEEGEEIDEEDGEYARLKGEMDIHGEHDKVWINCCKCKKAIWIFT